MTPKETGAVLPAPPTSNLSDDRPDRRNGQGETEGSAVLTATNDQIGDVYAPGAGAGHSVRPLPLEIRHSDHKCVQVWRDEIHAVYKHFGAYGQDVGWEAIRIKRKKAAVVFGKEYPEREVYPSNEDFGRYALSVGAQYDLEYAIEKAKTLKPKAEASLSHIVAGRTGNNQLEQLPNTYCKGTNNNPNSNK